MKYGAIFLTVIGVILFIILGPFHKKSDSSKAEKSTVTEALPLSATTKDDYVHQGDAKKTDEPIQTRPKPSDDNCEEECFDNLLKGLISESRLSKADYRKLTGDMDELVAYLSSNPNIVKDLAIEVKQDNGGSHSIVHILRQLPFDTLSAIINEITFSDDQSTRLSALALIDLAYSSSKGSNLQAQKEDLTDMLTSVIYTESNIENKVYAFEVLANHKWKTTDDSVLNNLTGVFEEELTPELKAKALETVAMFGGNLIGFEDTLVNGLSTASSNIEKNGALTALHNLGLFIDDDDSQQLALLARFEGPLRAFIDNEPEKSPFSHRATQILERYYGNLSH
ncbi:hypothetical protein J3L16_02045 [Alteromonas sp. 5E99-2]|uniref:hypothetical protein n=1 Tax=Alteromonas sp. 5E99-2 TaxID=2817683 RepID=UPI001A9A0E43|nr:hypothetical protein [Alteromonas sp. 5E99-2]MBO1254463.1 hypothetical protein [Alteromonas sp. 5E99-2]